MFTLDENISKFKVGLIRKSNEIAENPISISGIVEAVPIG